MFETRVEIKGAKEVQDLIKRMQREGDKKLEKMLAEGALNTENVSKRSIQQHQSAGITYQRGNTTHTASRPGQPPNTDTGNLVNNITISKISGGYDVGSRTGAPYGLWLEFGTLKTAARPWLTPAYEKIVKPLIDKYTRRGLV